MSLTTSQWRFIAARLLTSTDKEAAEQIKISPVTVAGWKQESPEFSAEYLASFTDGVNVAKSYTRKLLGKAAQRLGEALDALDPDSGAPAWKYRLQAAEVLLKAHGLLRDKVDIELRVRQIAEANGIDPDEAVKAAESIIAAQKAQS